VSRTANDGRIFQPHVARNRQPILDVLRPRLAPGSRVLEIGSGTGEHGWYFAKHLPQVQWQPSEPEPDRAYRADAFRRAEPLPNLAAARPLDAMANDWGIDPVDVVYAANVIHIAPWDVCRGIVEGASRHLAGGGRLMLYGPFIVGGEHTAPSNAAFSERLQARDSRWGVRALEDVAEIAERSGLKLRERVAMPANNFVVIFGAR
jgi:SAM-dependent methyltransferase